MSTAAPVHPEVHLGHRAGSSDYRRTLAALFAAGIATFVLLYSTQALFPELSAEFGVSSEQSTWSLSLTTLGLGFALLVAGPLSDAVGRTRLIHVSVTSASVLAVAASLAPTWHTLLAARLLEGVALAGLPAVATAYLREELHPETHARAAGLYVAGTAIGGMSSRLLTGPVGEVAGWRWALGSAALVAALCAVVVRLLLPASRHFVPSSRSPRAVVAMARRALSDRALLALYAAGACVAGAFVGVLNTLGFRLTAAPFGLGLATASLVFAVYPLGSVSSVVAGRTADLLGRRAVLPIGAVVAVAGTLLTLVPSLPVVVLGLGLLTIGFFAVHAVASGWVPARAHAGGVSTGQAASMYLVSYYLGASLFGSLAGRSWGSAGWDGVVGLATGLLVVAGCLALVLRRTPTLLEASR